MLRFRNFELPKEESKVSTARPALPPLLHMDNLAAYPITF
jgi:hypothetical protein